MPLPPRSGDRTCCLCSNESMFTAQHCAQIIGKFFVVFCGSMVVGIMIALFISFFFRPGIPRYWRGLGDAHAHKCGSVPAQTPLRLHHNPAVVHVCTMHESWHSHLPHVPVALRHSELHDSAPNLEISLVGLHAFAGALRCPASRGRCEPLWAVCCCVAQLWCGARARRNVLTANVLLAWSASQRI